jgi:hypothetical protein
MLLALPCLLCPILQSNTCSLFVHSLSSMLSAQVFSRARVRALWEIIVRGSEALALMRFCFFFTLPLFLARFPRPQAPSPATERPRTRRGGWCFRCCWACSRIRAKRWRWRRRGPRTRCTCGAFGSGTRTPSGLWWPNSTASAAGRAEAEAEEGVAAAGAARRTKVWRKAAATRAGRLRARARRRPWLRGCCAPCR